MLKAGIGAIRKWVVAGTLSDPDVVLYAAWISVWGRWFVWLVDVFLLAYRPGFWYPQDIELLLLHVLLLGTNGLVHHRLLTNRPVPLALDALPRRHGHCPDHSQRCHRRRIQQLHLPGLLPGPRHFCRGSSRPPGSLSPGRRRSPLLTPPCA